MSSFGLDLAIIAKFAKKTPHFPSIYGDNLRGWGIPVIPVNPRDWGEYRDFTVTTGYSWGVLKNPGIDRGVFGGKYGVFWLQILL